MRARMAGGVIALAFCACSSMKVSTSSMPDAPQRLASAHTYAWLPEPGSAVRNPFVREAVMQAVDRDLATKGYQRVEPSAEPDFLLGWHSTSQQVTEVESPYHYGVGYPYGPYGGAWGPPHVYTYTKGTLLLDVVDPATNRLLWRADARANLGDNPTSEDARKKVDEAVGKMLAEFPPKPEKATAQGGD